MNFIDYINKQYGLNTFMGWLVNWIEVQEWDFPKFLLNDVPKPYLKRYIEEVTLYRGMVISLTNVLDLDACSWTSDYNIAKEFSEQENYYDILVNQYDIIHSVVYVKKDLGINFSKILEDVYKEMLKQNYNKDDLEIAKTIYLKFKREKEYISDFKLSDVKIKYLKEMLIEF